MPATPPAPGDPVADLVAAQLAMMLPPECVAGVQTNLAMLATHWAALRAASEPDGPAA